MNNPVGLPRAVDGIRAPVLAEGMLADHPGWVVGIALVWSSIGVFVAFLLHRRGHGFGPHAALGLVFGPLYIALAVDAVRHREHRIQPRVLREGVSGGGAVHVLVALDDSGGDPAMLHRWLGHLYPSLGLVALASSIDYDSIGDEDAPSWNRAVTDLETWADCIADYKPRTILVPGSPDRALSAYARREGYVLVVVPGGWGSAALAGKPLALDSEWDLPVLVLPRPGVLS